jgi:hypothetical protein
MSRAVGLYWLDRLTCFSVRFDGAPAAFQVKPFGADRVARALIWQTTANLPGSDAQLYASICVVYKQVRAWISA